MKNFVGNKGTGGKPPEPPKEFRCPICGEDTRQIGHGHGGGGRSLDASAEPK